MIDKKYNEYLTQAIVVDSNNNNYFVQNKGITFQLPKSQVKYSLKNGNVVNGFVYKNYKGKECMVTLLPKAFFNLYGWGKVVKINKLVGVFVDIGLPDKDIVVSYDILPESFQRWPKIGDELFISLYKDHKNRIWGKLADTKNIKNNYDTIIYNKKMNNIHINEAVVYEIHSKFSYALTNDHHIGIIYDNNCDVLPRLGEKVHGFHVIGSIYNILKLSLKPSKTKIIKDDADMLMAVLKRNKNNKIPLDDKSDPKLIYNFLGISKSSFKCALGYLYKRKMIKFLDGSTILVKKE